MGYIIITSEALHVIVQNVELYISRGWLPQGGVSYCQDTGQYIQAMVKTV